MRFKVGLMSVGGDYIDVSPSSGEPPPGIPRFMQYADHPNHTACTIVENTMTAMDVTMDGFIDSALDRAGTGKGP